jgi:hypothetical protein
MATQTTPETKQPFVVAYGMGVDSTAVIVGLVARGIRPDLILFANVGGEKQVTYDYLPVINAYLRANNFPEVTEVAYVPKNFKHWPPYFSLEENCLTNGTLPSKAFGFGSCSMKWKAQPQDKYLKTWAPAVEAWKAGMKVKKAVGYDNSKRDVQRRQTADKVCTSSTYKENNTAQYDYWYPLQDWGWDRDECIRQIAAAGLPVPEKSSCFFCPAMKTHEVDALPQDKLVRIVLMEQRAMPRLTVVKGLWRKATKARPASMTEYIAEKGLLSPEQISKVKQVPTALLDYQKEFAAGTSTKVFSKFIEEAVSEIVTEEVVA